MTVRNYQRTIYLRQEELLPLDRFYWLEPVAGFFHLQINLLSMMFGKFWGGTDNVVFLNCYSGILKRKHICKKPDNNNFHYINKLFRVVIETIVVTLCMHLARLSTIDELQTWISRSNWLALISKIEHNYLGIFTVQRI